VLDARHKEVFTALYSTEPSVSFASPCEPDPLAMAGESGRSLRLRSLAIPKDLTGILVLPPAGFYGALSERIRALAGEGAGLPPGPCILVGPGAALLPDPPEGFAKGPENGPDAAVLARLGQLRYLAEGAGANPPLPLYGRTPAIFKTWTPPARIPAREALEGPRDG
jgi:hypothetical protein